MKPSVFLDSSVWFAAICSPTGGSAFVFERSNKDFKIITSKTILAETEKNVQEKLHFYHLERFAHLISKAKTLPKPTLLTLVERAKKVIVEKDAVILAEAKNAKCDYFLTLDRKHFLKDPVQSFIKPTKIFTPGDFIENFYKKKFQNPAWFNH